MAPSLTLPSLLNICYLIFLSFLSHVKPFILPAHVGTGSTQLNTELAGHTAGWLMEDARRPAHAPEAHTEGFG